MKSVVFIAGPTAGGKSALALALAKQFGGVVINADSMQVYRDLRVITARPSAEEEGRAPHRLYGVIDGAEACSVARWRDMAQAEVAAAWAENRLPILTGGTGMYFKVLAEGIAAIPDIPDAVREEGRALLAEKGIEIMHQALAEADPALAARLPPKDRQRIMRGWEVWRATGAPLSAWQEKPAVGGLAARKDVKIARFVLAPERGALYARCDRRFEAMMEQGALEEAEALRARNLPPDLPVMKALGAPPLIDYLGNRRGLEEAVALSQRDTRRYAKRQLTWFRNQCADWHWLDQQDYIEKSSDFLSKIVL